VLRIFIALKSPSSSAGFEAANLGSSGKVDNHYTAENDIANARKIIEPGSGNSFPGHTAHVINDTSVVTEKKQQCVPVPE
jgi:hypothetical protein